MKIYYKLPLLLAVYSIFLTSLLFSHLWYSENSELEKHALREAQLQMSHLQAELTNAFQNNDNLEIQRELSWLSAVPEVMSIFITDESDWILQGARLGWGGKHASEIIQQYDKSLAKKVRENDKLFSIFSQDRQSILLYYPLNFIEEGKLRPQQSHCIFMHYNLEYRKNKLFWSYWQEIKLAFFIAILASLGLMFLLYQLIYYRVEKLVQVSQNISEEHYNIRVQLTGNDELTKLGTTFNEMAKHLEQAHHDLYQQNRLYNALSDTNQAIVRTQDVHSLFAQLCDISVKVIGLENTWILFCNETDQNNYLKIISAGDSCECIFNLRLTPQDLDSQDDNFITRVWHYKKPLILNEFDPHLIPFGCYKGAACKVKSIAVFPLFQKNEMIGILNFCATEPQFFISDRLKLIEEIVTDLCYALDNLANEQQRIKIQETLRKERGFFKAIIDNIPIMIVNYKMDQEIISVNKEFKRLMGFKPDNLKYTSELYQLFENTNNKITWHDYKLLNYYGEMIDTSWACVGLQENTQIGIGIDLTEHKKAERFIRHLAYFDPLTNLPNRRSWSEFANRHLSIENQNPHKQMVLLCLDLDRFKTINDTRGHDIGDKLLMQVAERLKDCVRGNDMLARLGGDEFAFLLLGAGKHEAIATAQQILSSLSSPFTFEHYELKIGGSIGITCYPNDGENLDILYKYADIAMYHAKQEKLGYAFFEIDQANKLEENVALEQALQQAVKDNQLYLYYQPRINLIDEKVTSVEALLRWNHEQQGNVSPEIFIALAEQSSLIHEIDEWVLRTACQQAKLWQTKGLSLRVAINLSVKALQRDNLFERIETILLETEMRGEWLEIEITETAALDDFEVVCDLLLKLKSLGIHLSIDDFGTGYSSLTYLKHLPVNSLKIDHSLLHESENPLSVNSRIVRSILYLARNLGLSVVAEGVETIEQQMFLKNLGCESVQGFYYSQAIAPEKLEELGRTFDWFK